MSYVIDFSYRKKHSRALQSKEFNDNLISDAHRNDMSAAA